MIHFWINLVICPKVIYFCLIEQVYKEINTDLLMARDIDRLLIVIGYGN